MFTYNDPTVTGLELDMQALHAESDARLASCHKLITEIEARQHADKKRRENVEKLLAEYQIAIITPSAKVSVQKLPEATLKLKVAEFELQRRTDEYKRLEARQLDTRRSEVRVKKENRQLVETIKSLNAQLVADPELEASRLRSENGKLKEELSAMKMQLKDMVERCEMKDQSIRDLREDFAVYQTLTSDTWAHRHDGCDELAAALEEQCSLLTKQRDTLENNLAALHHSMYVVASERDGLQSQFVNAIKAHKTHLGSLDPVKCDDAPNCASCVSSLERALRISRAAESQALKLVDQVNYDRMVAWNQLHEHQTKAIQKHHASVSPCIVIGQSFGVSPALVSPTYKHVESDSDGSRFSGSPCSSESGSVEFVL